MVITLVIIGILSVLSLFLNPNSELYKLNNTAYELLNQLRYAQNLAINQSIATTLTLTGLNYQLNQSAALVNPLTGSSQAKALTLDTLGLSANISGGVIAFDSNGIPYGNNNQVLTTPGVITLTSGGNSVTLSISPQTGWLQLS
jgi:Tfp pilus assembly protein FimT